MLLGPSGRGKSYSLRNLPPAHTRIINTERKTLPFKGSDKIPQDRPRTVKEFFECMSEHLADKDCKALVIESMSAFLDTLLQEARVLKTGWDVYDYYNQKIYAMFETVKKFNDAGKHVIVINHDDVNTNELTGKSTVSAKVKGQEWRGIMEKEFDIVLHSEMELDEKDQKPHYYFRTQTDGMVPAKSPAEMFDEILIDNDIFEVLKKIKEYDS